MVDLRSKQERAEIIFASITQSPFKYLINFILNIKITINYSKGKRYHK